MRLISEQNDLYGWLMLIAILLAAPAAGQSSAGATRTLSNIPKSAASSPSVVLDSMCTLDADALFYGCTDSYECGPSTAVPCAEYELPGGLDFTAAGAGLRNMGSGAISLRGVPAGSTPVAAWLIWGVIAEETAVLGGPELPGSKASIDGFQVSGETLGMAEEPCWLDTGIFVAYRAWVLDLLRPEINGDYFVAVEDSARIDGADPWSGDSTSAALADPASHLTEGASLVLIYSHPEIGSQARVYLHVGPYTFSESVKFHHVLTPPLPPGSLLRHLRLGADGQTKSGGEVPVVPIETWIGSGVSTLLRGLQSEIDRHADWQGLDGGAVLQLWDTQVTQTTMHLTPWATPGVGFYKVRYSAVASGEGSLNDCVVMVAHGLGVR